MASMLAAEVVTDLLAEGQLLVLVGGRDILSAHVFVRLSRLPFRPLVDDVLSQNPRNKLKSPVLPVAERQTAALNLSLDRPLSIGLHP